MSHCSCITLALALMLFSSVGRAADTKGGEPRSADQLLSRKADMQTRSHFFFEPWSTERSRFFASARADLGFLFFRPHLAVGYGLPFENWLGAELVPIISSGQIGGYTGLRYRNDWLKLRSGFLLSRSFFFSDLAPQESYDARDLMTLDGNAQFYTASDSEVSWSLDTPLGELRSETQAIFLFAQEKSAPVYVATLGAVIGAPFALRQQLRFLYGFQSVPGLFLGPVIEVVVSPFRDARSIIRGGAVARFWLYEDLELRTDLMPNISAPDRLGRRSNHWLQFSARFRWASGKP